MSDMQFILTLIGIVVFSPVFILAVIMFWALVIHLIGRVYDMFHPPPPPYCDIDPRCHGAFAFDKDGNGWIGNVCVIDNRESQ